MAIDFNKLATSGEHASTLDFTKAVEVTVGERIDLNKSHPDLRKVRVEMYWESDQDGDVAAILLGESGKAVPGGIAFYNQTELPGVTHSGDCRGDVDNDPSTPEETITIDLQAVNLDVKSIPIVAGTHPKLEGVDLEGNVFIIPKEDLKPVPFGRLRDCRVLLINDETSEVLFGFELSEDFHQFTSVEMASFYRKDGGWRYTSLAEGVGKSMVALEDFVSKYDIK